MTYGYYTLIHKSETSQGKTLRIIRQIKIRWWNVQLTSYKMLIT